jgi:hypothetical protein
MPRLSQLMIRTALVWLALGYTLGGLVLLNKGVSLLPWLWTLRASHVHSLLAGWTMQLACGVAFWILPRRDSGFSRGDERPVWLCYGALNTGAALGALHDPLAALADTTLVRAIPVLIGLLYLIAAVAFVAHAWPRIRSFRALPRPDRVTRNSSEADVAE